MSTKRKRRLPMKLYVAFGLYSNIEKKDGRGMAVIQARNYKQAIKVLHDAVNEAILTWHLNWSERPLRCIGRSTLRGRPSVVEAMSQLL